MGTVLQNSVRAFSIKRRIITAVVMAELILVVSLVFLASYLMRRHAVQSFDSALQGRAMSVAALVRYSEGPRPELQFDGTLVPSPLTEGVPDLFQIKTKDGRILASSGHGWDGTSNKAQPGVWEFSWAGVDYRGLRLPQVPVLDSEENEPKSAVTLDVIYAATTREMTRSLSRALAGVLSGGVLLLVLSVYASVHAIEKGLRPLSELASSANSISSADWDLRLPPSAVNVTELVPLTRAMSQMVATLRDAFQQQRDFTSNAAHELKTPVAIMKSTLQYLLQEPRPPEMYHAGITDALSDVARLEALLHSMLRLARAEQSGGSDRTKLSDVDVLSTCEAAIARLTHLAQNRRTTLSLSAPDDLLLVRAEPEDLEIVWTNLIDNAIRYSPPKSEVKVTAVRNNGIVRIVVEDNGPGISSSELTRVFERFHRSDESRSRESGGYGLGLAISKAFVERYGGAIAASQRQPAGTLITVEFPVLS